MATVTALAIALALLGMSAAWACTSPKGGTIITSCTASAGVCTPAGGSVPLGANMTITAIGAGAAANDSGYALVMNPALGVVTHETDLSTVTHGCMVAGSKANQNIIDAGPYSSDANGSIPPLATIVGGGALPSGTVPTGAGAYLACFMNFDASNTPLRDTNPAVFVVT